MNGQVVLDRPCLPGGLSAEGPVLQPAFTSGVGWLPIAQSYGMTMGELANMFNNHFMANYSTQKADLHVVPMRGWKRGTRAEDLGLPFVPPSPKYCSFFFLSVFLCVCVCVCMFTHDRV